MNRTFRWPPILLGCGIGALATLGGLYLSETVEHISRLPAPSSAAVARPLQPTPIDPTWVKEGSPKLRVVGQAATPTVSAGIWSCEGPATFEWTFWDDERVYVLDGSVTVNYRGKEFTLRPGDTALFLSGTKAIWHVPTYVKKTFVLEKPNRMVRLYRRLAGIV